MKILWARKSEVEAAVKNKKGFVAFYPYTRLSPGDEGKLYVVRELAEQKQDFESIKQFKGSFEEWIQLQTK